MNRLMAAVFVLVLCAGAVIGARVFAESKVNASSCTFNGHKLYGKIQVVTSFPDLKVKVTNSFPDLKVQVVTAFPDSCGEWQMVDSFPDLKVQFVEAFPDVTIQYVSSFPGVP